MTSPDAGVFNITVKLPRGSSTSSEALSSGELPEEVSILLLEDEENVASAVEKILSATLGKTSKLNIQTFAGSSGLEALSSKPDAILCDVKLDDINGKDVFEKLENNHPDLINKLAFMSGDTVSAQVEDLLKVSGCKILKKPFEAETLAELVKELVLAD